MAFKQVFLLMVAFLAMRSSHIFSLLACKWHEAPPSSQKGGGALPPLKGGYSDPGTRMALGMEGTFCTLSHVNLYAESRAFCQILVDFCTLSHVDDLTGLRGSQDTFPRCPGLAW